MSQATAHRPWIVSTVVRLASPEVVRFAKFALVGGSGVVVNMGMLWFATTVLFAGLAHTTAVAWAGALAIGVSIVSNFLLNDIWTWADRRESGLSRCAVRFAKYGLVASVAGVVQWLVLQGLVQVGMHYLLANMVGIGAGIVINYVANNWWTFRVNAQEHPAP